MRLVVVMFLMMLEITLYAQKQYGVFDWKSEHTLNINLAQRMHEQFGHRRKNLSKALLSEQGIVSYRDSCRARYQRLVGQMPVRMPLNVKISGTINMTGYRIERLSYESIPNHHVTANLYIPEGNGPYPGVLLFCGHEPEAKATDSYQKTAVLFARNGFVTLVIDPISQGERHQLTDASGKPLTRGGTTEHTLINAAANLVGTSAVAYMLWDNIRGLDLLESRAEVDKDRIGCLGNSGGGTQTTYFIGFDDRVKVAAPCSYVARRERNFDLVGANDGCQHMLFEGENHFEISDFLIMFAPKPLMILAGRYDFVDYTGTLDVHAELTGVYKSMRANDRFQMVTIDDGHGISQPKREAAVSWFRRWLYNDDKPVKETNISSLSPEDLAATSTLQVNNQFASEVNDFQRTRVLADSYKKQRGNNVVSKQLVLTANKITESSEPAEAEFIGTQEANTLTWHKYIVRRKNEVPLPILAVFPAHRARRVILLFNPGGKHLIADSIVLIQRKLKEGNIVVLADLPGFGEMKDPLTLNDSKYFNEEYRNAILAIHTGTSLPAMRTSAILTLLAFISGDERSHRLPIDIYATEAATLPAMQAAVVDHRITNVVIGDSINSFYQLFEDPMMKNWYSYVIPHILRCYDIEDLEKALSNRLEKVKSPSIWSYEINSAGRGRKQNVRDN